MTRLILSEKCLNFYPSLPTTLPPVTLLFQNLIMYLRLQNDIRICTNMQSI